MLRGPVGLILAGGGAQGSWQAGCLEGLVAGGLRFDKVFGISAGSLNGAAYALGRMGQLVEFWTDIDRLNVVRWDLRWRPLSFLSNQPLWDALRHMHDDEAARDALRCPLTAVSLCLDDREYHYARFTPDGAAGWDGPLAAKLVASCAVRWAFPPMRLKHQGRDRLFVDGGVKGRGWVSFAEMSGCKDVVLLQMLRPEEVGRARPLARLMGDQMGRDIAESTRALRALPNAPRVFRVYPDERLRFTPWGFESKYCAPAVEAGRRVARAFLADPSSYLLQ